jgi:hypothetical protein
VVAFLHSGGVKLTTHLHLVPRLSVSGSIPQLRQYVLMAWYLGKHRDNFTFTFLYSSDKDLTKIDEVDYRLLADGDPEHDYIMCIFIYTLYNKEIRLKLNFLYTKYVQTAVNHSN